MRVKIVAIVYFSGGLLVLVQFLQLKLDRCLRYQQNMRACIGTFELLDFYWFGTVVLHCLERTVHLFLAA